MTLISEADFPPLRQSKASLWLRGSSVMKTWFTLLPSSLQEEKSAPCCSGSKSDAPAVKKGPTSGGLVGATDPKIFWSFLLFVCLSPANNLLPSICCLQLTKQEGATSWLLTSEQGQQSHFWRIWGVFHIWHMKQCRFTSSQYPHECSLNTDYTRVRYYVTGCSVARCPGVVWWYSLETPPVWMYQMFYMLRWQLDVYSDSLSLTCFSCLGDVGEHCYCERVPSIAQHSEGAARSPRLEQQHVSVAPNLQHARLFVIMSTVCADPIHEYACYMPIDA